MKKKSNASIIIAACVLAVVCIPVAFILINRAVTNKQQQRIAQEESMRAASEKAEADAGKEEEAKKAAEEQKKEDTSQGQDPGEGPYDASAELDEDQIWIGEICKEAFDKMIAEGELAPSAIDEKDWFLFDTSDGELDFLTEDAKNKYLKAPFSINEKVIWSLYNPGTGYEAFTRVYLGDEKDGPVYATKQAEGVPEEIFADSLGECGTLFVAAGLISRVDEKFYYSKIDRKMMSTVVFVIDVETRTVSHIEQIGADCPGAKTEYTTGKFLHSEAVEYMSKLCMEAAQ